MSTTQATHTTTLPRWSACISSLILLLATIFYWELVDLLTVFLAPLLALTVWAGFLISSAYALTTLLWGRTRHYALRFAPLLIHLIAFLIIRYVPFHTMMLDLNFSMNYERRMQIVHQIENREIATDLADGERVVALPLAYRHLSRGGGDVIIERSAIRTIVFFYTFRGVTDNFSGFMYRSDGSAPQQYDLGGNYVNIKKLRDHWYWVAAT
jgi:hypothetical protein